MANSNKLTPDQVAKRFNMHVQTVRKWIRKQFLPATNWSCGTGHGARYEIDEEQCAQFERWMATRGATAQPVEIHTTNPSLRAISGGLSL